MDVSLSLKSCLKSRGISVPDTSVYDSCVNLAHEYSLSAEDVADELEAVNDGKDINQAMLVVIRNSLVSMKCRLSYECCPYVKFPCRERKRAVSTLLLLYCVPLGVRRRRGRVAALQADLVSRVLVHLLLLPLSALSIKPAWALCRGTAQRLHRQLRLARNL
jgi:hypothetical protein